MTDMPLKQAVQTILSSFVGQRKSCHDDIAEDVYRTIRDEANSLLERELICNVFDSDPFGLIKTENKNDDDVEDRLKNVEMIARIKKLLTVVSCSRTATADGYSFIQAVVQLDNDGNMRGVEDNVRIHFSFLREPQQNDIGDNNIKDTYEENANQSEEDDSKLVKDCDQNYTQNSKRTHGESFGDNSTIQTKKPKYEESKSNIDQAVANDDSSNDKITNRAFNPKTIITYKIEYSVDWGKLEKLFGVDIYAAGVFPSIEEAIPIMDDDNHITGLDSNIDTENSAITAEKRNNREFGFTEIETSPNDDDEESITSNAYNDADRFGVFVDPENILAFVEHLNLNANDQFVFRFLLMFPFYEHEWDVSGFLLSSLIDDETDGEEDGVSND